MYKYTLWTPNKYQPYSEPVGCTYLDGNLANAKRHAHRMLGVAYETDYSARVGRRPYVDMYCRDKHGQWHSMPCVEQPVHYVPSVGDLGYSP